MIHQENKNAPNVCVCGWILCQNLLQTLSDLQYSKLLLDTHPALRNTQHYFLHYSLSQVTTKSGHSASLRLFCEF